MKLLILGCNGMVGHVVAQFMRENGHEAIGYDEQASDLLDTMCGSIYSTDRISDCIGMVSPDAIINCTAIVNEYAEKDKAAAAFVNAYIPHYLEEFTKGTETVVVHRSTDCVFSGERGRYTILDVPDGQSFYARTKAVGEIVNEKDITIRTSLIGPEREASGEGLFSWYMRQTGEVNGFANSIWTGLTTIEFAREIEKLLRLRAHGLFQMVPSHAISKYKLLTLFETYFPNERRLRKLENRMNDKSLVQELRGYDVHIPDYEAMIAEMAKWIKKRNNIYPY